MVSEKMDQEKNEYIVCESQLKGTIHISGAKNSALKLLSASLLTNEEIYIENYPATILDAIIHVGMLEKLGKQCNVYSDRVIIRENEYPTSQLKWENRSIRNTLLILGALVARTGFGAVPLPGGCQIGERKYDLHEMLLNKMGAKVWEENNILYAEAKRGLIGNDIFLPIRSTGATENALICGSLAKGLTRIWNPHKSPEIIDLITFLKSMGAKINIFGQEHFEVIGVDSLSGTKHSVIPDNKEAITWLIASVMTEGEIEIKNFPYKDLEVPLVHLRESGANYYFGDSSIIVKGGKCYPFEISTGSYPSIHSDMQPLFASYASCAKGLSRIIDFRYPDRFGYATELGKMGMKYKLKNNMLEIFGGSPLKGTKVQAIDLRAGMSLVLAGLVAEGDTNIINAWQIERGYDNFVKKLQSVGGNITYGDS